MLTHRNHHERGQSLVEFAAIAPILFLLVFGIIEFGRAFYAYNAIVNAASEGARYGILDPQNTSCIKKVVKNYSVALELADPDISVACQGSCAYPNKISVTANYTYTAITPFVPNLSFSGTSSMWIVSTSLKTC